MDAACSSRPVTCESSSCRLTIIGVVSLKDARDHALKQGCKMDATVISAIIAAVTALGVMLVTYGIQRSTSKMQDFKRINEEYLNPLRLYLEENYFRIVEILRRVEAGGGKYEILLSI